MALPSRNTSVRSSADSQAPKLTLGSCTPRVWQAYLDGGYRKYRPFLKGRRPVSSSCLVSASHNTNPDKTFFCSAVIFGVSATAMKLSILFFYHRIFSIRRFTIASSIIGIVVLAWFISYMAFQFFGCRPLAYQWDKTIPGGHCIDFRHEAYYGTSPPDIATNIAILVLPIPYLWKLQMAAAKKV